MADTQTGRSPTYSYASRSSSDIDIGYAPGIGRSLGTGSGGAIGRFDPEKAQRASRRFIKKWEDYMYSSFENRGRMHGSPYRKRQAATSTQSRVSEGVSSGGSRTFNAANPTFRSGLFDRRVPAHIRAATAEQYARVTDRTTNAPKAYAKGRFLEAVTHDKLGPGKSWMKRPNMDLLRNTASTGWMMRLNISDGPQTSASSRDQTREFVSSAETRFGSMPREGRVGEGIALLGPMTRRQTKDEISQMFRSNSKPTGAVRRVNRSLI